MFARTPLCWLMAGAERRVQRVELLDVWRRCMTCLMLGQFSHVIPSWAGPLPPVNGSGGGAVLPTFLSWRLAGLQPPSPLGQRGYSYHVPVWIEIWKECAIAWEEVICLAATTARQPCQSQRKRWRMTFRIQLARDHTLYCSLAWHHKGSYWIPMICLYGKNKLFSAQKGFWMQFNLCLFYHISCQIKGYEFHGVWSALGWIV